MQYSRFVLYYLILSIYFIVNVLALGNNGNAPVIEATSTNTGEHIIQTQKENLANAINTSISNIMYGLFMLLCQAEHSGLIHGSQILPDGHIRHQSDAKVSERCIIDVDWRCMLPGLLVIRVAWKMLNHSCWCITNVLACILHGREEASEFQSVNACKLRYIHFSETQHCLKCDKYYRSYFKFPIDAGSLGLMTNLNLKLIILMDSNTNTT